MNLVDAHHLLGRRNADIGRNGFRIARHDLLRLDPEKILLVFSHRPAHVPVGNHTDQLAVLDDRGNPEPGVADRNDDLAEGHRLRNARNAVLAHHVAHAGQQPASEASARMKHGVILRLEIPHLHQRDRQRVAHHKHRGRRRRGSQIQRTRFAPHIDIQMKMCIFSQR